MSVEISDALARDLLWWVQNNPTPYVIIVEQWTQGKKSMMEIARDSIVEELMEAIKHSKTEPFDLDLFEGMDLDRTYSDNLEKLTKKVAEGK